MTRPAGEGGRPSPADPAPHPTPLVIFDIDGTLGPVTAAGSRALRSAARDCFGRDGDPAGLRLSGRTDAAIFGDYSERLGLARAAWRCGAFLREYERRVEAELEADWAPLPGVRELVAALAGDDRFCLAVGTGNLSCAAHIKLRRLRLHALAAGGFGEDSEDRAGMVAVARARAEEHHGGSLPPAAAVVVGDAVGDVEAARANGMRSLAVGTGPAGHGVAAAAPDLYVPNMAATRHLIDWLAG